MSTMMIHTPDPDAMAEATRLTREGRLTEATALIQRTLGGGPFASMHGVPDEHPDAARDAAAPATGRPALPRGGTTVAGSADAAARPESSSTDRRGGGLGGLLRRMKTRLSERPAPSPDADLPVNLRGGLPAMKPAGGGLPGVNLPGGLTGLNLPGVGLAGGQPGPAPAGMTRHLHSSPHGERPYLLYVPETLGNEPVPLVVMLHGGTQDGAAFASATGMNALADEHGFVVAYPEQVTSANPMRYWNWFSPADQNRGGGEAALLADLVHGVGREAPIDTDRVFVAGFSAGAAMAAVLGDQYPDVFAAVGVHSGLASGAARDVGSAFAAMRQASRPRPSTGDTRAIVFHGDADPTVSVDNAAAVTAQFCPSPVSSLTENGRVAASWTRKVLHDNENRSHELWTVHGSGHAWSGGTAGGSYTDPNGPDASAEMVRFFLS